MEKEITLTIKESELALIKIALRKASVQLQESEEKIDKNISKQMQELYKGLLNK